MKQKKIIFKEILSLSKIGHLPFPGLFSTLCAFIVSLIFPKIVILLIIIIISAFLTLLKSYAKENQQKLIFYIRKDPKEIVLDEFLSFLIVSLFFSKIQELILGVFLLRLIDNSKFYPIRKIEQIKSFYSVFLDDIIAGIYTIIIIKLIFLFL